MRLQDIKELLAGEPSLEQLNELLQDQRAGVQKLLAAYHKRKAQELEERQRFEELLSYEREGYAQGHHYIAGVDEAGRGPLAGPLVIASCILPEEVFIAGLNDSKQLSAVKRDRLYDEILEKAVDICINVVSVSNIDRLNIYGATQQGMGEVLLGLARKPDLGLIDAMPLAVKGMEIKSIIHGDALSVSIAAASIIAKVTRDRMMVYLDKLYPGYGWAGNKGYGAAAHMEAVGRLGATHWHRRSYEPVKSMGLAPVEERPNIVYRPQVETIDWEKILI